jgi:hypothetical protein
MSFDTLLFFYPDPCIFWLAMASGPAAPNLQKSHAHQLSSLLLYVCRKQMTETIDGIFDNGLQSELHRTEGIE